MSQKISNGTKDRNWKYALRGMTQTIGISEYELSKAIPKNLKSNLPTIEKIEKELVTTLAKKT